MMQFSELPIIHSLITCKGLHEFDRKLNQALPKILACDCVGFYLYSPSTKSFSPVSDLLTHPTFPGYSIAQLPSKGTMKEAVVQRGTTLLENDLAGSPWAEAAILKAAPFQTASVLIAP